MSIKPTRYETLELLPAGSMALERQIQAKPRPVTRALRAAGAYILAVLAPSSEPQVKMQSTRDGALQFAAYDPVTHRRCACVSEESLRCWLEMRYYVAPVR
ncbi:MAG: hypothetical protein ACFB4J_14030 [Elainellaceae cyanobacterium]